MKETMDRKIEKKRGVRAAFTTKALPWWGGAVFIGLVLWLVFRDSSSTLRINADTVTAADVIQGEFNDYIRISGQVQPMVTIQISPLEGGVVKEIIREEGSSVRKGDQFRSGTCRKGEYSAQHNDTDGAAETVRQAGKAAA